MIYVGIDDTDTKDSPGTNKLARALVGELRPDYETVVAVRHQLLFDRRIPYTRKNSSASILLRTRAGGSVEDLAARIRGLMRERFVEGSDPGLCVTERVGREVTEFGRRCQRDVVSQQEARRLAARQALHLEGLGGTEDGVIGALAAVGLAGGGNDGRVVQIGNWPDDLSGPQDIALLRARGVAEVRCHQTGWVISEGRVDVGKRLRPSYRGGRVVLYVAPAPEDAPADYLWRAVRLA